MKTHTLNINLLMLLALLIISSACRKKVPDGLNADFNVSFNNNGMAPDIVVMTADFDDADSYQWSIEKGDPFFGQQTSASFGTAGSFDVELLVESGKYDRKKTLSVSIENFPSGTALTVVQEDGIIGSTGLDGEAPFWAPIDTLDDGTLTGMDYDDETKQLYYTGSIYRAFPNGVGREKIFDDSQLQPYEKIVDLVVDSYDKRVYFAINGFQTQSVASVRDDGSDLNFLFQFTNSPPIQHITLDAAANEVYFTSDFSTSISKTIQGDVTTAYGDNNQKHALVFDNSTRYLYYAEQGVDNSGAARYDILRFKPDLYNPEFPDTWPEIIVPAASRDTIRGIDISESKQQLYWSDSEEQVIYRIDLNNLQAKKEIVFEDVVNPRALAVGDFD